MPYDRLLKTNRIKPHQASDNQIKQLLQLVMRDLSAAVRNLENAPDWPYSKTYPGGVSLRCGSRCGVRVVYVRVWNPFSSIASGKINPGNKSMMKKQEVIQLIRQHERELSDRYAVKSLALFGSVARDEANPTSDIDLLVEFDRPVGLFGLFALQDRLEEIFGSKVDLGTPNSLKPRLRASVLSEMEYVS